ncbi:DUF6220 domain-containing protein [Sporosarcina thermotolerans]|uniref:DUF6220 domain-containing protein n=1 Tax=Sporosarcina thermotolerans TaxID=633404 RepID=A0AAW9A5Q1_9BACL|nr:DUF6220 domain-containing protein [Sporosarcina thermotolerans]MDW0116259.1 DUF6220 domain-containing protein [Sporosarcina thermotolerans]
MEVNNSRIRVGRIIFFILTILFTLCIFVQFYLAGKAIFEYPVYWSKHIKFVHLFGFNLPVLMLIFAILGSLPRWAYWQLSGIFLSIYLMYFTANIRSVLPWVGSIHPVVGILLFVLSFLLLSKSWKLIFRKNL